ncbi:XdhC family aldehyde oxidoreductase maturation factor [Clostridium sp. OS1-26]|uniref:XdhC family aldehyde oxidoreductase maturation factor n=1 Tax=Clostridium sp. OS1-26 TaxID=3070681 RepID=UPI0027E00538|nr:xanthine dehydrogenase accessory protein XdhC [Clostridium sp. OS1-26]WML33860.1 xanthine dehydrogenase accessory protein XdhC [Clostridium sp. OS1-26]
MRDIYEVMTECLDNKESFVLATILEKSGSAPREEGTKMIIKNDFSIEGTIGGGIFEAMAIKLSSQIFENKEFIIKKFALSNNGASALGMVCGGELKLLLEYIDCNDDEMVLMYKKAAELKRKAVNFAFITKIEEKQKNIKGTEKWICTETGFFGEENDIAQCIFRKVRENFKNITFQNLVAEGKKYLVEPVLNHEAVYIIGAGHVSQKIAEITKMLDFKTIIIDDREEFANRERFKTADEVKAIPSFENIFNYINIDSRSYIIIVTRGHAYDKEVLARMLKTDARYIGMIGSKTKRDFVYNCLLNEGYTSKDMERVYCPIGLSISAQTPEEIAVSIAAELVLVRRSHISE